MAKIFPFRGVIYDISKTGNITDVVTQPYDKIDKKMQEDYYNRSEYSIVRLIKGKEMPGDNENENKYTRARDFLNEWLKEEILVRDEEPAIYVSFQKYKVQGEVRTRKGFVALAALEPPGEGVKAHEHTLAGPKADRLNLMRATGSNFGHIFMLYSDPENTINLALDAYVASHEPLFTAQDYYGETHQIWRITDQTTISLIQDVMKDKTLFIADGHHRYETAVNYMMEMKQKHPQVPNAVENYTNRMMTFVNMDSKGLSVLPTHRVIHDVKDFTPEDLLEKASKNFDIEKIEYSSLDEDRKKKELLSKVNDIGKENHVFGLAIKGENSYWILKLKEEALENIDQLIEEPYSTQWKTLDITILHSLLLEDILGIDKVALEEKRNIHYIREKEKGFDMLEEDPDVQMVFFVNPTKAEQVKEIASLGERMPQKSTDFYPKILTGLVINVMEW